MIKCFRVAGHVCACVYFWEWSAYQHHLECRLSLHSQVTSSPRHKQNQKLRQEAAGEEEIEGKKLVKRGRNKGKESEESRSHRENVCVCLRANGNICHFLFGSLSCSPAPESLKYKLKLSGRCRAFTANSTLQSVPDALHLSTSDRYFTRKLRSNRSSGEARREGGKGKKGRTVGMCRRETERGLGG